MVPFIIQLCGGTITRMSAVSKPLNPSLGRREANKLPRPWLCADEAVLHTLAAAPGFGIGPLPEGNLLPSSNNCVTGHL